MGATFYIYCIIAVENFNMDQSSSKSWETVYRENIARLTGICYRYAGNRQTAEDLAHEAFLVAISKSYTFQNKGPLAGWIRRIAINLCLQYLRDQKKKQALEISLGHPLPHSILPEEELATGPDINDISKEELLHAISNLPQQHGLVFNLYVIDKFSHAQISMMLGIAEGTSKSHLARARKKIRELLIANKLKDKKNSFLVLFICRFRSIDALYSKQLKNLAIEGKLPPSSSVAYRYNMPVYTNPDAITAFNVYRNVLTAVKVSVTGIAVSAILYGNIPPQNTPAPLTKSVQAETAENKVFISPSITATDSNNRILFTEQTKKSVKMKNLIPAAALLLSNAVTTTPLLASSIVPDLSKRVASMLSQQKTKDTLVTAEPVRGTIYASKLKWMEENYSIEISGSKVAVNLNTQHFKGSGTFNFIDNIHLLIVDGKTIELNTTIDLAAKVYSFVQLSKEDAIRKYGDKGKNGAVIVSVKEE